jgi:hypothetical protein
MRCNFDQIHYDVLGLLISLFMKKTHIHDQRVHKNTRRKDFPSAGISMLVA